MEAKQKKVIWKITEDIGIEYDNKKRKYSTLPIKKYVKKKSAFGVVELMNNLLRIKF